VRALLIIAVLAGTASADDGVINYRVRAGDTFELLAAEFYQDRRDAVYLLEANGLEHPKKLVAGEVLKIPVSRNVVADKNDTFPKLAERYLGASTRAPYLAKFNNRDVNEHLPVGTPITIPFTVRHVAKGTESIAQLAANYIGAAAAKETDLASMLKGYNGIGADRDTIAKGEAILIPVYTVRTKAAKTTALDADSKTRSDARAKNVDRVASALPASRAAWRTGAYATVRNELRGIDIEFLDTAIAIEVGVLRGAADVAFGLEADAQGEFEAVLKRKQDHQLLDYDYSPKILEVWNKAKLAAQPSP